MKVEFCQRCKRNWCFRGEGKPRRCGKCKSPYWDRPREKELLAAAVKAKAGRVEKESKFEREDLQPLEDTF